MKTTITKTWSRKPITVQEEWEERFAACTSTGYSTRAKTLALAEQIARSYSSSGDRKIIARAKYRTRVVDGPTGFYYSNGRPTLDAEDADISRDLVLL